MHALYLADACPHQPTGERLQVTISAGMQVDRIKRTREVVGTVAEHCSAITSAANGGQIICNTATLSGIRPQLAELHKGCTGAAPQRTMSRPARCAQLTCDLLPRGPSAAFCLTGPARTSCRNQPQP